MACERKLLESEATTGFFVLLGEQGNKAALDWVMKDGLIPSRYESPNCEKDMRFFERNSTIDGFEWRCRVQSEENPHFACRSVRKDELLASMGALIERLPYRYDCNDDYDTAVSPGTQGRRRVEKLAYQLNEEAEQTERPIRILSKVMYGSTCADMQVDVMGECLSSIKHVVDHRFTTLETISNYRNSYPGFSSGRPRGTTPADDRYIVLQAKRNRRQTAGEIARHTTQSTGRPISRFTVARRLHGGGLFARRPKRCVPLTPARRRRRSLWCREHRNWRDNELGRLLFTDESRFSLSSDSHRILIWREREAAIIPRTSLKGTGAMGLQFLFMDNNAPCHRTVAAEQLLESEDIERMDWPARSPDLNPIQHVWDFSRQTLGSSYLTTSNDSGASIGAARRMGSNASTTH
ncbi:transposable element Tcb1 transposase [Trichonephila clavipes]|nr:transposable element Tcb1 transposase [Trichonephila clavipes]